MRRLLVVANFKSNLTPVETAALVDQLNDQLWPSPGVEVVLAPTTLCLTTAAEQLDRRRLQLASQTGSAPDQGPYTGEVSFAQLAGLVDYSLVGHSERRQLGETNRQLAAKVRAAVYHQITPIICVGETKSERVNQETGQVLSDQVTTALADLTAAEAARVVIAYEPVWALSDGHNYHQTKTPTVSELGRVLGTIRTIVGSWHGQLASQGLRLLYGGSVNATNAETFLATSGLDGLLVGGASLRPFDLAAIVAAAGRQLAEAPATTDRVVRTD